MHRTEIAVYYSVMNIDTQRIMRVRGVNKKVWKILSFFREKSLQMPFFLSFAKIGLSEILQKNRIMPQIL